MGFKAVEDFLRRTFNGYGLLVGKHPLPFLAAPLVLNAVLTLGLVVFFNMDVDCVRLFTPRNSPSLREVRMLQQFSRQGDSSANVGDRDKELTIAAGNNESSSSSSSSLFEKAKQIKYFWYDIHMITYDEDNILDKDVWRDIVELIREIYDNFTCTINEPDHSRRRFNFIPDFCRPEVGCGRVDRNFANLFNLLKLAKEYPDSPNIEVGYPVMQVFGLSVYWGLFVQGVQMNSTTGEILEAHLLTIPLQFEYDPSSQKLSTVYSCMDQLSKFFSEKSPADNLVRVYTASEKFFTDEVARTQDRVMPYIAINIALITAFCILTTVESDGSLKIIGGTFGLMTIGMALLSGFGLMLYAGYSYNFMISATPFIVMCVGIDNDFLLLAAWRHTDPEKSSAQRLADSLTIAGPSVTITSLTDVVCFLIGVVSGTLAVSSFCLFTAMALFFRFFYQMTFFIAVLIYSGRRKENRLQAHSTRPGSHKFTIFRICPCLKNCLKLKTRKVDDDEYFMNKFFRRHWGPVLMRAGVKIFGLCLLVAYILFSLWRAVQMTINISPERVVSDDSLFVDVVHLAEKYSWPYNVIGHVYVKSPPDFRNYTNRKMMVDFLAELENTKYFTTTSSTGLIFWMKDFLKYLNFVNNGNQGNAEILDDMIIDNDFIADFYTQLESFLSLTENAKFIGDIHFKSSAVSTGVPDVESFQMIVFFQQVTTWDDHVKLLYHWRNACSQFPQLDALVADHSSLNPYLDQRVTLSPTLLQTMGIALLSMTLVTTIFMPDIIGIFYITLSFISVDIGVIGFLEVWQCNLDPATLTGILMTNGFSVYYTARVCYNYQCTDKTMDAKEKVIETMAVVGWPILQGGMGTIIGIAPLAFMKTYTTRTFFKTIVLVVLAGLLHGLLFIPIMLSSLDSSGKKHASVEKRRRSTKVSPQN